MPELRQDPLTESWVIIATERSKRPSDYAGNGEERESRGICPFCLGNEKMTPPEIYAVRKEGTNPDSPGWTVRVTENKFPALRNQGEPDERQIGFYKVMNGVGAHEVIVESPDHNRSFFEEDDAQVFQIIKAWRNRIADLGSDTRIKYAQLFKNYGAVAGASLSHPHSQLIAVPVVPEDIQKEIEGMDKIHASTGKCFFCETASFETAEKVRLVLNNNSFTVFCPFASRFPFEMLVVPKQHQKHFTSISDEEIADLGRVLKQVLEMLAEALQDPPFNFFIHTAPYALPEDRDYHWHMKIFPRLTKAAGFEWGTGCFINPTPPETAAEYLRAAGRYELEEENECTSV